MRKDHLRASSEVSVSPSEHVTSTMIMVHSFMRRISKETWDQIKTAYASGIGLREIARQMGIPAGTILARAKREGWTQQIQSAKALAKREDSAPAVTATEAVAITMQQRGERHLEPVRVAPAIS
jgi:adenine/guanine phosphoribosyltransferase-like PRPP-binding protein